jgi:hypothetical protein
MNFCGKADSFFTTLVGFTALLSASFEAEYTPKSKHRVEKNFYPTENQTPACKPNVSKPI